MNKMSVIPAIMLLLGSASFGASAPANSATKNVASATATGTTHFVASVPATGSTRLAEAAPAVASTIVSESAVDPATVPKTPAKRGVRLIPIANADLRAGWTTVKNGKGARGLTGSAMALPAIQLPGKGGIILPIYAFSGSVSDRVVEESILFSSRQTHMLSLGYKNTITGNWEGKISGDGAWAITKETFSEKFGKGLYDYRDLGGRASVAWKPKREGKEEPVTLGFRYFKRAYPNFKSLASENQAFLMQVNPSAAAAIADKEKHPKDFSGMEIDAGAERWLIETLKGSLGYTLALHPYADRYLRSDQGLITDKKRADAIHRVETRFDWLGLEKTDIWTSIDYLYFGSTGNNYDPSQPDYAYTPHFYQFSDLTWRVGGTYQLPFGESLHPSVNTSLGAGLRNYSSRHAQDANGVNLKPKQSESTLSADLGVNWPINKWLGVVGGLGGEMVKSNNKFTRYLKYSYNLASVSLGLTAKY